MSKLSLTVTQNQMSLFSFYFFSIELVIMPNVTTSLVKWILVWQIFFKDFFCVSQKLKTLRMKDWKETKRKIPNLKS